MRPVSEMSIDTILESLYWLAYGYLLILTSLNLYLLVRGINEKRRGDLKSLFVTTDEIIRVNVQMIPLGGIAIIILVMLR